MPREASAYDLGIAIDCALSTWILVIDLVCGRRTNRDQPIRARLRFGDRTVVTSYVLEAVPEDEPDYDE